MLTKIFKTTFYIFLINLIIFCLGAKVQSENDFDFFINDFLNKNNEALQILREVELNLKNGSKEKSCSKQKNAARIGILATESLLKAYKINNSSPPRDIIDLNKKRWLSILENC